jgi:hypothetical protein
MSGFYLVKLQSSDREMELYVPNEHLSPFDKTLFAYMANDYKEYYHTQTDSPYLEWIPAREWAEDYQEEEEEEEEDDEEEYVERQPPLVPIADMSEFPLHRTTVATLLRHRVTGYCMDTALTLKEMEYVRSLDESKGWAVGHDEFAPWLTLPNEDENNLYRLCETLPLPENQVYLGTVVLYASIV